MRLLFLLSLPPWDSAFVFDDVDDTLDAFESILSEVVKKVIPKKQKRVKKTKQPSWIDKNIVSAIKKRDRELKIARKTNCPNDWSKYKRSKCYVTNLVGKSNRMYFQQSIDNNKGNPKGIWKALKSLTKSQKSTKITELRREDGTLETDTSAMANILNEYFVNIAQGLKQSQTSSVSFNSSKLEEFVSSTVDNFVTQFNIPLITVQETQKFIDNLSSSKATGADEISVKVLKLVSPVFVQPLTRLINLSIQSGCFPTKWKMVRVTPLFKDGAQDCRDNFRPISVLSILSKVCEKHVAASFMDYLVKTGLLYELQSAFRAGYSTESALISLTDQILFNLDGDKLSGMVFVDFRKAFDVVDHQLLLTKLRLYRVSDPSLSWFESYLSGRQQFVSIDGQRSDSLLIKQGVPQGSVLGPALFLLFVNDIPLHLTNSTVDIYADDTTINASAHFSDLCSMTQRLNSDLDAVQRWASSNKMFINKKKTKSLLVHGKHIPAKLDEDTPLRLDVKIDDSVIEQVSSHKILGVVIVKRTTNHTLMNYVRNVPNA